MPKGNSNVIHVMHYGDPKRASVMPIASERSAREACQMEDFLPVSASLMWMQNAAVVAGICTVSTRSELEMRLNLM